MSNSIETCPKCNTLMTELKGGFRYCTNCGFNGETEKTQTDSRKNSSQRVFWFVLISPAALALCSYIVGQTSESGRDIGVVVGMLDLLIGAVASIYCGVWLARRFFKSAVVRALLGLLMVFGLGFVYFGMIFAGCSPNIRF